MPTFRVKSPDGATYDVNAPDGATEEQAIAYVQRQHAQPQRSVSQPPVAPDPTEGMSTTDKFLAGMGKAFVDTGRGVQQIGADVGSLLPDAMGGSYFAGKADQLKQEQADVTQRDAPLMQTGAGAIGNVAGQAAQMAVPIGGLGVLGKAAPFVRAAITSGAVAGAQPVTGDESRLENTAIGAGAGAAGQGIASGLSKLAQASAPALSDATQKGIQLLHDAGVPLHFSQLTDSKFAKTAASAANYLPFSGGSKAAAAQQAGFNRAVGKTIGVDSTSLSPEVIKKASTAIGNQYNNLFSRAKVMISTDDVGRLVDIAKQAATDLPPEQAKVVQNQISKFINAAGNNDGAIPGRLYQNIRATLMPMEKNQPTGYLVGQVRKAMQDAAENSMGPEDAKLLADLNGKYRNLKIVQKALTRTDGADDNVNPARLWSLVNGKYGSTDEMRALAQAGQLVLKNPIPDSGTAARNVVYGMMGLGGPAMGVMNPSMLAPAAGAVATGATLGRALNSQAAARYLPGVTSRTLNKLALLARPAPIIAPAVVGAEKQK